MKPESRELIPPPLPTQTHKNPESTLKVSGIGVKSGGRSRVEQILGRILPAALPSYQRIDMWYLYLDESGDLGFDFVNKRPSKYFSITILLIKDDLNRKRLCNAAKRTLHKKLNPKGKRKRLVHELKASNTTDGIKRYFLKRLLDSDFSLFGLTLNKRRVYEHLTRDKSRVYNWVARLLLDHIDFPGTPDRIALILDKSKGKREIEEFNKYIRRQLEAKIDPKIPLEIRHEDSCSDYCLSAVDLFAWGIFRKHERRDFNWWELFKHKVIWEDVYLP
jgi:hypothetical protein